MRELAKCFRWKSIVCHGDVGNVGYGMWGKFARVWGMWGGVRSWVLLQAGSMPCLRLQQRLLPHL